MQTDERTGKIRSLELVLSDMVMKTVADMKVLTLHPDYFRLSRPVDRRVYEMARKSVGQGDSWTHGMASLHKKSGSKGNLREFRRQMKPIIEKDYLPDCMVIYDDDADQVTFVNRKTMPIERDKPDAGAQSILLLLSPDVRDRARTIARGWDIDHVQQCFAAWWSKIDRPHPKNPDAMFLKFCRTWQEKNGSPR